jgi:hypothetical protein
MTSKIFNIFGLNILFELDESKESSVLLEELSCYPEQESINHDLIIQYISDQNIVDDAIAINPSTHYLFSDGFSMKIASITTRFIFSENKLSKILFSYNSKNIGFIIKTFRKWKHIQFLNERESIGQIVHEVLLVPINFFLPTRSIIHASAVVSKKGKLLMFGGTGGVGKTSLELELCRNHDCSFFADDMCVSDDSGHAFPNLSFPKIYGYNLINNEKLKKVIISNKPSDKLHWKLHSLRGLDKVRRRISPSILYKNVTNAAQQIDSFFILNRTNVRQIEIKVIENDFASMLNTEVIKSEYQIVFQHLHWHKYNAMINSKEEISTFESIMNKNAEVFSDSLNKAGAKSYIIHIPVHLKNEELKEQISKHLKNLDLI